MSVRETAKTCRNWNRPGSAARTFELTPVAGRGQAGEEEQKTVQWTVAPPNGRVERKNRAIQHATTKRDDHDDHEQLRWPLEPFLDVHNHALRLQLLKDLVPTRFIGTTWPPKFGSLYKSHAASWRD
jgi:hypothetical protein